MPATKVRIPAVPATSVRRNRLVERIRSHTGPPAGSAGAAADPAPVVLVAAPAGSGKTTLLSTWASQVRAGPAGPRVAWVCLDAEDNSVAALWSAILVALETTGAWREDGALHRLRPPHLMEPDFLAAVVDAFDELSEPVWLVLDDVHELHDPAALRSLDMVLRRMPPRLRLVLSARSEPRLGLPRLRLEGRLAEIGIDQLTFTGEEAAALLAEHRIRLGSGDLNRLLRRTEGWAAGLRLAAMTLAGAANPAASVAEFGRNDRAVADYLVAEVLSHQPGHVVDFLLAVSVCARFTGELAVELSGRDDAGELLDRLERANAFVFRPDRTSDWYRPHRLLGGYLRAELARRDASALPRLHGVAARWFAAHDLPVRALEHAIRAGDAELTSRLVATIGLPEVMDGRGTPFRRLLDRVAPKLLARPAVALVAAVAALEAGDVATADAALERMATPSGGHGSTGLRVLHATVAMHRARLGGGDPPAARETLDALAVLDPPAASTVATTAAGTGDAEVDVLALAQRGAARLVAGEYGAGEGDLRRGLEAASARGHDATVLHCLVHLAAVAAAGSDLAEAATRADTAIAFAAERGWSHTPGCAYAYGLGAWAAYHRLDRDVAGSYASLAVRLLHGRMSPDVELAALSADQIVGFDTADDRHASVGALRDHWRRLAGQRVAPFLVGLEAPVEQRLALRVGEPGWATEVADRVEGWLGETGESSLLRATLQVQKGRVDTARALLRPVLDGAVGSHMLTTLIDAWLLEAVLADRAGDGFRAHRALGEAVELAAPRRSLRAFVDGGAPVRSLLVAGIGRFGRHEWFAAEVLAAMPPAGPGATDVLTPRELELLAELPSLRTAEEIAESLLVSVNTVKTHLRGIYQKLGVNNRRHAIEVARQRGLL
ncbi:MAG TPA: LuxR C-terminal-related transcriptional regulator [Mycobacteriales bacterium]|nr:LuxR C-terminal-related transcriptional regulator [Mycobacteriales bacterium]